MRPIKHIMALALILGVTATTSFAQTGERKLNIDERMINRRAIEVIVWSQPLMGFKAVRGAFLATGAKYNDVTYYSKVQ
jgi:predicted S18 family serine protease